jgi:hypothetical protein
MKKMVRIIAIIAIIAMASVGNFASAYAQAPGQATTDTEPAAPGTSDRIFNLPEDLHIAIGFKTWFSDWMAAGEVFNQGHSRKLDTDGKAWIPTLGVKYKDFFISASGLFGTDYHRAKVPHTAEGGVMRLSRKEVDVNLGYYVLSWLAVSAGYKGVFMDFTDDATALGVRRFEVEYKGHGPTLGLSINVPIPEWNEFPAGFSVYGNAGGGYMFLKERETFPPPGRAIRNYNHAWYSNVEGGIAYKPPPLPFILSVGYRFQNIAKSFSSNNEVNPNLPDKANDTLKGVVLGITFVY